MPKRLPPPLPPSPLSLKHKQLPRLNTKEKNQPNSRDSHPAGGPAQPGLLSNLWPACPPTCTRRGLAWRKPTRRGMRELGPLPSHHRNGLPLMHSDTQLCESISRIRLFATPWTVARQAPPSMGILQARILEWVAMHFFRVLPSPGIEPRSPALQAASLPFEPLGKPNTSEIDIRQSARSCTLCKAS